MLNYSLNDVIPNSLDSPLPHFRHERTYEIEQLAKNF